MATLKNFAVANIDNVLVDVLTAPASTALLVHNMILANVSGATITVDVTLIDSSAVVTAYLVKGATIPVGGSLIVLGDNNKQVLEAADKLQAKSDAVNSLDVVGAYLQQAV